MSFNDELRDLINKQSRENDSGTPDFILAGYMLDSLRAFERATVRREHYHGRATTIEAINGTKKK